MKIFRKYVDNFCELMTNYPQNHVDIPTATVDNNFATPITGQ